MAISRKSVATLNAKANALTQLFNGGTMEFRSGAIPASPAVADSGLLLASNLFASPAFGAAVNGVATVNPFVSKGFIATGNIGHARCKDIAGNVIMDLDAGIGTEAVILDKIAVATTEQVALTAFTIAENM